MDLDHSMKPSPQAASDPQQITRRSFALGTGAFTAAAILGSRVMAAPENAPKFEAYPFSLGIASGDPSPDGFVLWTRLAPMPLIPGGGMPGEPVEVSYQVSNDEGMSQIVSSGTVVAVSESAHSVHVEVEGLEPDRWYWYQFKVGSELSSKGRSRTLPVSSSLPEKLRFAFASCQNYQAGYYTAFEHMAREGVDLIVHLGDYIYEGGIKKDEVRRHNSRQVVTLDEYRARYALYKSDPMLKRAHEAAPWIVTWDDHEVSGDYAGSHSKDAAPADQFLRRRAAGYQAFYEHMPLRKASLPQGPDLKLYRGIDYGQLVSFSVLDTRQYRTVQPLGGGVVKPNKELMAPEGTILGGEQRTWLFERMKNSKTVWNVLAQQVMLALVDRKIGPEVEYSVDKWAGYEFERRRLIQFWQENKIRNPIVLTGDIHSNWANEIVDDFNGGKRKPVAVEFVGTSISSDGDGEADSKRNRNLLEENPNVKFRNDERGYVLCEVTPTTWKTLYRTVEYVSRPGAKINTRATFVVESGKPVLVRV